jgi:hypothetical protein
VLGFTPTLGQSGVATIYVHIEKSKRNKMQPKSFRCMFVGYDDRSKGYCYFNPLTKKVIVSKDVVFGEHSIRLSSSLVAIVKKNVN